MSSFSDFLEAAVLNHVFANTPYAAPTALFLALYSVSPTDAGGGTELAGSGYARQPITFGLSSGSSVSTTTQALFTATGGTFGTVVAIGIFDAISGGNLLAWDGITPATVEDGDSILFPVGQISVILD